MQTLSAANFSFSHPRGRIYGWFTPRGLASLLLPGPEHPSRRIPVLHSASNDMRYHVLCDALERYFAGVVEHFQHVPLDLEAATPFQREVWMAARSIEFGATQTYAGLAEAIGRPKSAARAVGRALGSNPIAIVIPCHRFVSATGDLTGFAAGLEWKRELLALEGSLLTA